MSLFICCTEATLGTIRLATCNISEAATAVRTSLRCALRLHVCQINYSICFVNFLHAYISLPCVQACT